MDIVTGYRGEPHVTSNDHQAFNYGALGDCILPVGDQLRGELITSTELRIYSGEIIHKGVHSRVKPGTYDTVALSNGAQNMKRIDLVCAKYSKAQNNVETSEWVVKQGTPTSGTPATPSHTNGNVIAGQTLDETPVFKVEYNGLNATLSPLLPVVMSVSELSSRAGKTPYALAMGNYVVGAQGTSGDDITIYTIPAGIDLNKVAVTVTNGNYGTNQIQMISSYIVQGNRTVHVKINANRIVAWYQVNYIIWYWG